MHTIRESILLLVVFVWIALFDQTCQAQGVMPVQSKSVAEAMLSQTGLHLPKGTSDIVSFIAMQGAETQCESIDVRWVSLPGNDLIPSQEAMRIRSAQSFSLLARRAILPICDPKSYRAFVSDLPWAEFIAFGTTRKDEIRGLYFIRDPRLIIAECPELFGGKSTPETRCGPFINPKISVSVTMPSDPELSRLVFVVKVFTGRDEWHLERLGVLELADVKD
jgi:hypothetical protein